MNIVKLQIKTAFGCPMNDSLSASSLSKTPDFSYPDLELVISIDHESEYEKTYLLSQNVPD